VHARRLGVIRRRVPVLDLVERADDIGIDAGLSRTSRAAVRSMGSPSSTQPFGNCQRPSCVRISATSKPPSSRGRKTTPPAETSCRVSTLLPRAGALPLRAAVAIGRDGGGRDAVAGAAVDLHCALRHRFEGIGHFAEERAGGVRAVFVEPAGGHAGEQFCALFDRGDGPDVKAAVRTASTTSGGA
jgi:hypothetical protein